MELADLTVSAWLDRGPAHQLFSTTDGRLVYRLLPTSSGELRKGAAPLTEKLAEALNAPAAGVPGDTRLHLPSASAESGGDELLLSCDDLSGRPLGSLLEPLPPVLALGLAARVVRGLQPLHEAGVYHAALLGSRLYLTEDAELLIADTGMAMMTEADPDRRLAPSVPGFAELYPTPALIPPEVFNWKPLSPASDVFLVGALTYRWMTGAYAHTGARVMDVYSSLRDGRRQPFPTLPANLNLAAIRLLEAALEPDPEARPSPSELAAALRPFVGIPLTPVLDKLDTARRYSNGFDQLSPQDAPGPPGSPAEQRRQEVLKRATLQLEVMKTQRDAGVSTASVGRRTASGATRRRGGSKWSWVLVVVLLVALGLLTPLVMDQMKGGAKPANPTPRAALEAPKPAVSPAVSGPSSGALLIPQPNAPDDAGFQPAAGTEPGGLVVTPSEAPRLNIRRRQSETEVHNGRLMDPESLPGTR